MKTKDKFGLKLFEQIVDHLWKNHELLFDENFYFEYPDYAGLPKRIAKTLTFDAVSIIREFFNYRYREKFTRKSQLEKILRRNLFLLAK